MSTTLACNANCNNRALYIIPPPVVSAREMHMVFLFSVSSVLSNASLKEAWRRSKVFYLYIACVYMKTCLHPTFMHGGVLACYLGLLIISSSGPIYYGRLTLLLPIIARSMWTRSINFMMWRGVRRIGCDRNCIFFWPDLIE